MLNPVLQGDGGIDWPKGDGPMPPPVSLCDSYQMRLARGRISQPWNQFGRQPGRIDRNGEQMCDRRPARPASLRCRCDPGQRAAVWRCIGHHWHAERPESGGVTIGAQQHWQCLGCQPGQHVGEQRLSSKRQQRLVHAAQPPALPACQDHCCNSLLHGPPSGNEGERLAKLRKIAMFNNPRRKRFDG